MKYITQEPDLVVSTSHYYIGKPDSKVNITFPDTMVAYYFDVS